jgi:transcriptional regulator with XRE-family HTH domain
MAQTKPLLEALKRELKRQGKSYRDVAGALGLSEASVKRLFAERSFNLSKLDHVCEFLGLEISELVKLMEQATHRITHLTLAQEQELVSDVKLLLMAHFLMSGWTFAEIIDTYAIGETEGIRLLAHLDRMKIIELLPGNRVRLMIANDFEWLENGPIQTFYQQQVQAEFLDASFTGAGEYRVFRSGMLTRAANAELVRRLKRAAREFNELCAGDEAFPLEQRFGTSLLIAVRPWGVRAFETFRKSAPKKF